MVDADGQRDAVLQRGNHLRRQLEPDEVDRRRLLRVLALHVLVGDGEDTTAARDLDPDPVLDAPEAPATDYRTAPASGGDASGGEEAPARSMGGGTLFERMSRLSRGATPPEGEDGDKEDGVDIPRFLGRQNNQ